MGGTIASEMSPDGLAPELTPEQLLEAVPEISSICIPECRELYSIDSTDITPDHWISLVRTIRELYEEYDGFVISHGTDTMAYTAAALSYMIQGSKKPVILTGSQKPMYSENTDSKVNLTDAFLCACSGDIHGVNIVFNGRVIQGTRARKTRSKSFQAFSSINYPDIAAVRGGRLMTYIRREYLLEPIFSDSLDANVGLMKLIPAQDFDLLEFLLERKTHGVVCAKTGAFAVNLPDPARFAIHKIIGLGEKSAAPREAEALDLEQAASLIEWHSEQGRLQHLQE